MWGVEIIIFKKFLLLYSFGQRISDRWGIILKLPTQKNSVLSWLFLKNHFKNCKACSGSWCSNMIDSPKSQFTWGLLLKRDDVLPDESWELRAPSTTTNFFNWVSSRSIHINSPYDDNGVPNQAEEGTWCRKVSRPVFYHFVQIYLLLRNWSKSKWSLFLTTIPSLLSSPSPNPGLKPKRDWGWSWS